MKKLTANDPETMSPDVAAENVARLKALFPEAITEGKKGIALDVDVLKGLVGDKTVTDAEEKYGLNWHGKRQARQLALTHSTGTLRPCPEESVNWEKAQNLVIEGDNLEVLKLLQKSYAGRVKLIYIDPPYNTGNDFVYPDNFRDSIANYEMLMGWRDSEGDKISSLATRQNTEASGRFHTAWLSMMYPRLKLARNLLRDDGVICISIGDEELPSLRLMMNEVFGEENHRNTIIVRRYDKNLSRQFMERGLFSLSVGFEYVVVYTKSANAVLNPVFREASEERQTTGYWKGFWNAPDRPTMRYNLLGVTPKDGQWKWKEVTAKEAVENYKKFSRDYSDKQTLEAHWAETGKSKKFIRRNPGGKGANQGVEHWIPPSDGVLRSSNWTDLLASSSLNGLDIPFENPKNPDVLRLLIEFTTDGGDLILDFFAGSGTLAEAAMREPAEEERRRFILVQLPEPLDPNDKGQKNAADLCDKIGKPRTIAELTKERLRRVGKKFTKENALFKPDTGFRVFKLASSNIRGWDPDRENLPAALETVVEHLKTSRTHMDIIFELLLKFGLDLTIAMEERTIAGKTVQSIGAGTLMACLAPKISRKEAESLALGIVEWHKALAPAGESIVVFRDSAFVDDVAKTNVAAILEQHGLGNVRSL